MNQEGQDSQDYYAFGESRRTLANQELAERETATYVAYRFEFTEG